jgi:hypothetical protein
MRHGGHGGARLGAGRKAGSLTRATEAKLAEVTASGVTPLDYMLGIMRDEAADRAARADMAKAAAPYVHAKLAAVDATLQANLDGSVTFTWIPPEGKEESDIPG